MMPKWGKNEFNSTVGALNNYIPKARKYIEAKNSLLNNVKNFYEGREKIIEGFKEGIFLLKSDGEFEQQTSKKPTKTDANAFNKWINKKETDINKKLFKKNILKKETDINKELFKKIF